MYGRHVGLLCWTDAHHQTEFRAVRSVLRFIAEPGVVGAVARPLLLLKQVLLYSDGIFVLKCIKSDTILLESQKAKTTLRLLRKCPSLFAVLCPTKLRRAAWTPLQTVVAGAASLMPMHDIHRFICVSGVAPMR
jgi:hypothetical protein